MRQYQEGDDLRRIHWPSVARTGELMIRQDESSRARERAHVLRHAVGWPRTHAHAGVRARGFGGGLDRRVARPSRVRAASRDHGRSRRRRCPRIGSWTRSRGSSHAEVRSMGPALAHLRAGSSPDTSLVFVSAPAGPRRGRPADPCRRRVRAEARRPDLPDRPRPPAPERQAQLEGRASQARLSLARAGWDVIVLPPSMRLQERWHTPRGTSARTHRLIGLVAALLLAAATALAFGRVFLGATSTPAAARRRDRGRRRWRSRSNAAASCSPPRRARPVSRSRSASSSSRRRRGTACPPPRRSARPWTPRRWSESKRGSRRRRRNRSLRCSSPRSSRSGRPCSLPTPSPSVPGVRSSGYPAGGAGGLRRHRARGVREAPLRGGVPGGGAARRLRGRLARVQGWGPVWSSARRGVATPRAGGARRLGSPPWAPPSSRRSSCPVSAPRRSSTSAPPAEDRDRDRSLRLGRRTCSPKDARRSAPGHRVPADVPQARRPPGLRRGDVETRRRGGGVLELGDPVPGSPPAVSRTRDHRHVPTSRSAGCRRRIP